MRTTAALFEDIPSAERAVNALVQAGFPKEKISLLTRHSGEDIAELDDLHMDRPERGVAQGAGTGMLGGGMLGGLVGLLAGLGLVSIPGLGPFLAAGAIGPVLGLAVGGSGVGAAAGTLLGAATALSIPEDDAKMYVEGLENGYTLVAVETEDERFPLARDLMKNAGSLDILTVHDKINRPSPENTGGPQLPSK